MMVMPLFTTLLMWLVAGVTLLVWWHIADRVVSSVVDIVRSVRLRRMEGSRKQFDVSGGDRDLGTTVSD